jgi:hypothetical protein
MDLFYNGSKLLSLMDLDGERPTFYMAMTNRSGGKSTWFYRLVMKRFLLHNKKFALLYRFKNELCGISAKFFKTIGMLFFPEYVMTETQKEKGAYVELFIQKRGDKNKIPCGYAICLNSADRLKKSSANFNDVDSIVFDEFQSETDFYCSKEIDKFMSVYQSIARGVVDGKGTSYRYVPVYMISNPVNILNPYFAVWKISHRLTEDTNFLRGHGWVLEQGYIENAADEIAASGFYKAFKGSNYMTYNISKKFLKNSTTFINKPDSKNNTYICTLRYNGRDYGVRLYSDENIVYCNDKPDMSYHIKISVTTADHDINYAMLMNYGAMIGQLRYYFTSGLCRFSDIDAKEAYMQAVAIR